MQRIVELADRYRLEEPLGRGGAGEVWRGVDLRLRRPVAVKLLPLTGTAEQADVDRFRREAEAAAALNHPGITTVFDVDEHRDGQERWLFLVMELMVGRDLRYLLADHPEGLPIERVRGLAVQVTEALGVAHRGGVVHRDIKPANLFLLDEDRVKICDFGIARLTDATSITATGSVAGTPRYMAPEQIQGEPVDHRTDLYAFGCVLYELLTGKPLVPVDANIGAILYRHLYQPSVPPKSVRADIPDELDALVCDLLAKRPDDRPQDAATVTGRLRGDLAEPRRTPRDGPPTAVPSGFAGDTQPPVAATETLPPSPSVPRRTGRRTVLLGGLAAAVVAGAPTAWFLLDDDPAAPSTSAGGPSTSTIAAFTGHTDVIESVAFSPDGKTLATGSADQTVRLWDVRTGRTIATFIGHTAGINSVAFSPDGEKVATGSNDNTARIWNVRTGKTVATFTSGTDSAVMSVAFSPDGKTLATGSIANPPNAAVRLWDAAAGRATGTFAGHTGPVNSVRFSPDGKTLATGGDNEAARLWNVGTGRGVGAFGRAGKVESVAFSPDGKTLATGSSDKAAQLWSVRTGRAIGAFAGHSGGVNSVAFSPDGKTLATSSTDEAARLWDVRTGRAIATFASRADGAITSVAFSPDGKTLVIGDDQTARQWTIK